MTAPVRMLLQGVVALIAAAVFLGALLWATEHPRNPTASGLRAPATPQATAGELPTVDPTESPQATPTPAPTATPAPTPTPIPVAFHEAAGYPEWEDIYEPPVPGCAFEPYAPSVAGTVRLRCLPDASDRSVTAVAPGRVVVVNREPASAGGGEEGDSGWDWADQAALGPHVVVDHGPYAGHLNVQTLYAGLDDIDESISVGEPVEPGRPLGTLAGPAAELLFSLWTDDVRQDGVTVVAAAPPVEQQQAVAASLGEVLGPPTDEDCPLGFDFGSLPGASRSYRNGTHRGIDFGCGAAERTAYAVADGTVVYLVDDYADPTVAEREALLANAGRAGFTPHWILMMLYGNVVVIDHGDLGDAGRVVTISAHLEAVDPAITLGGTVTKGQALGEIGNRGTNASAQGLRGAADPSLHLHWELYVDGWYLGAGLPSPTVSELVRTALCGAEPTPGCPA